MQQTPPAPALDADLESLEAAFLLPAREPRTAGRPVRPLRINPDAALVPDSPVMPLDGAERIALAMFAAIAVGAIALVAVALFG